MKDERQFIMRALEQFLIHTSHYRRDISRLYILHLHFLRKDVALLRLTHQPFVFPLL